MRLSAFKFSLTLLTEGLAGASTSLICDVHLEAGMAPQEMPRAWSEAKPDCPLDHSLGSSSHDFLPGSVQGDSSLHSQAVVPLHASAGICIVELLNLPSLLNAAGSASWSFPILGSHC